MSDIVTELKGPELAPLSGGDPEQLVILLHGYGSDGQDLISLAPEFAKSLPKAQFLSPNAPFRCEMSPFGYQWFSLATYNNRAMYEGAEDVAPILNHYIDQMLHRFGLEDKNLAFIGFSQGTMMSLHVALRRDNPCAGIVGFSGSLLDYEPIDEHIKSRPKVALIHGVMDPVVPYAALGNAVDALEKNNINIRHLSRPLLPHAIDMEGIEFAKEFLADVFLK